MENNNRNEYGFTASYVANLTLKKVQGQIEFSRARVSEYLDKEGTDQIEILAAFQVLDLYETLIKSVIRATYPLREKGAMNSNKSADLKALREEVDAFANKIDGLFGCSGNRADYSNERSKRAGL